MESVLEEARAQSNPVGLPLHHCLSREQQNNEGKSLGAKNVESAIEEAGAINSSVVLSLHQGLSRDQENNNDKSSVLTNTNVDAVVRENGKYDAYENSAKKIECEGEDTLGKPGSDKETSLSFVVKVDDKKERENGLSSEHDCEIENNKITGDHHSARDADIVDESENHDVTRNTICGSGGKKMETCSDETEKIRSSEGKFVHSSHTNGVRRSKCDMQVGEGISHEKEQEYDENGCRTEQVGHNESEYPGNKSCCGDGKLKEKDALTSIICISNAGDSEDKSLLNNDSERLTEDEKESEGIICSKEVVVKRSENEDSEIICNGDVMMDRSRIRDYNDKNAVGKDGNKLIKDTEESEGVSSNDEEVVKRNEILDSESNNSMHDADKSIENAEEIEEQNFSPESMPADHVKELEADMSRKERKSKKSIIDVIEEERGEVNLDMTERKEMTDVDMREVKENKMDLEISKGEEIDVEMVEEKERDIERTQRNEKGVEMAEGKKGNVEIAEEIGVDTERMEGKEKERDAEIAEGKEMSGEMSQETEEMDVEMKEEKEKQLECKEAEGGGTGGEGVDEEREESQACKPESCIMEVSLAQTFNYQKKEKREKQEECTEKIYIPLEKETTQKTANDVTELTKESKQDKLEEKTGSKESEANEEVGKRLGEYDASNLNRASSDHTKQNEPKIQEVEKSNSGQNNEERETLNQQEEVQQNTLTSQVTKQSNHLLRSECISLEVSPQGVNQSLRGEEVTVKAGQCGEKNDSGEMRCKGIGSVTPTYEKEQSSLNVGNAFCSTSEIMSGKKNIAKKSTSKVNCGSPQRSKDQSIDLKKMNERKQHRRKRVKAFAGPDTQTSSPLQHPAKEVPNSSMAGQKNGRSTMVPGIVRMERSKPGAVYLYTGHPGGSLAPLPLSTLMPRPSVQIEEVLESDDSDIEIISEKIVSRNVSMPVKKPHLVCDACQIIWNNDVLEAIFEGNKAVTVNSKITYGAILCFNYYVETHHWQDKEQTLRNVLERADLGKNIGTLKMTEVIKLLSRMMRDGSVKCCDVFDAVYNATNVSNLHSLLNSDSEDASELASWQQNIQKPVEETNKRRTSNSSRVNSLENASSGTSKVTTLQNASSKVPEPESVRKASKSTETQVKSNESPIISGDVLKGAKASRKNSNVHAPKPPLKDTCSGSDEIPVTHEKICLKECTVYLGKRVQVPQQKVCVQSVSSSPTISKRRSSFEDVSMEVSCKKKGIISGLPMSDKESTDTEGSIKSKDEKEAVEQTASKESTTVECPPTKESTTVACSLASKRKQCLEKEVDKELPLVKNGRIPGLPLSAKESTDTQDSFNFEDTDLVEQTASKKSTTEVSNQSFDNDESKMTTDKDKCKEKTKEEGMIKLDTVENEKSTHDSSYDRDASSLPMELSDEKSTSESENKINESDKETSEKDTVGVQKDLKEKIMPQAKSHDNRNCQILSNTEKVKETSIMQMEDKTKRVKQDVPTDMMASSRLPKQKKRPSIDPTSQSSKKRRTLNEVEGELPDENLSTCLLDDDGKLSPINCKKKKSKTKHVTSTDSGHSEDLLLYLENSSGSSSDEPPQSCESSDEVDFKGSGKRLVSPIERTRSEKSLKSPKALRRRSQRVPSVKKVVTSSESSSDNCDQQLTYSGDLTPPSRKSMDGKLGPLSENNEESTNILIQQLGLNVSGINLYCSVTDTRIFTNGDMANNSSEREKSIPALEIMLKERSNLDGVAREAFDLLPFEPNNFSFTGNNGSRERYLTNQELLVLQNICVLNPENPDVDMFYQILIQILLARKRVLLVPNSLSLLLVAEGIRREFNRAKRKGSYVLYLSQDWDANKIYTAEDFWLGNKRPPNVPSVCTVLSMFCLWKNLEKRVPISFPIALEELCRNLVLLDVDKIGICVKLYSRYCTFLYEEKNPSLAEFFLKQPFLGSQTELKKKNLLCMMEENSKQTSGKSSTNHSFNVTENDVQRLMKKCMEAEQAALRSSSPRDEENFRKCVQALKYKIDAYKKEIHQIQKVTKETQKKKLQLLSKLNSPQFKDCTKGLSKTVETLYRVLSKRTTKFEMIREVESMSVKETNRISRPPLVVLKGTDLGEDISESMKELVYDLLINEVKMEEVRPVLCVIVQNLSDKDLSVVPTDSWIRNFARVAGLKVRRSSNLLRW